MSCTSFFGVRPDPRRGSRDDVGRAAESEGAAALIEGSAVLYCHHDQLGSTRLLTDQGGSVAATYSYDPYGRLTAIAGGEAAASNPLRYAGEYSDAETGFLYLRNRYYDPATGQFLTRDPLTAMTGSPYGYAGGDPLNFTDPAGLYPGEGLVNATGRFVKNHAGEITETALIVGGVVCIVATDGACAPVAGKALAYGATTLIGSGAVGLFIYDAHEIGRTPWKDEGGPRPCPDDSYDRLGRTSLGLLGSAGPLPDPVPHSGELPPSAPPPAPPFIVP